MERSNHIKERRKPLTLCIPTNGVIEWVFPVLDSIYEQGVDDSQFEVVVTDNGQDEEFKSMMRDYTAAHENLTYLETSAPLFLNMIECFKAAEGEFIKFVNHRTLLLEGALEEYLGFVAANRMTRPVVYFSNGAIKGIEGQKHFYSFDDFVREISYCASWSTGIGFWRDNFEAMPKTLDSFNETFPHTTILFNVRDASEYIVDNRKLLREIPVSHANKGRYNLFKAFAVEYLALTLDLVREGDVTITSFLNIKEDTRHFLAGLYFDFVLMKKPCSYDLSSYDEAIRVFYSRGEMRRAILRCSLARIKGKISRAFLR